MVNQDLELVDDVNTFDLSESGKGYHGKLSTLLEWHFSDPVDSFERNRNEVIFSYQNNRNPFIDYPEFVEKIWQITVVNEIAEKPFRIYPNPASNFIQIEIDSEQYAEGVIYSMDGRTILNFEVSGKLKLMLMDLIPGMYMIIINIQNKVFTEKVIIKD